MAPPGMLVHKITVVFIVIIIYDAYGSSTDNFCQIAGPCCSRCLVKGCVIEITIYKSDER